jgi:release factor glutamine methyltransferase
LQYLLGRAGFFALDLEVSEGVFIPRPETEVLVEAILEELAGSANERAKIIDIGTGSGAISIALAVNLAQAELMATDVSGAALRTARRNAVKCGVANRIRFEACDLFPSDEEAFDVVVSNPPYIPSGGLPKLAREVRSFEPWEALDGGPEGLGIIRRIVPEAKERLVAGGLLVLEVGEGQAEQVVALLRHEAFESIAIKNDLSGVERVVSGRKISQGEKTGKHNG